MSKQEVIAVIDGDEIAFQIAAVCEERKIKATNSTNSESATFKHRTEMKKFLAGLEIPEDFFIVEDVQIAQELSSALHSVKVSLANIKKSCNADKVELYLSGEGNFRDNIPLPIRYKSNRDDTIKPVLLKQIRQYMVDHQGAKIVNLQEVDDVCATRMYDGFKTKQKIIGVTTDKDAMGNSGWLFNPDKMTIPEKIEGLGSLWLDTKVNSKGKEESKVRGKGRKWGYAQWLMGDPTDCYNPTEICKVRYGEKSAYKLLEPLQTDLECLQAVYDQYKKWYPQEIITYTDWEGNERNVDVFFIMQMYFDCYRMRRWENDTVDVKEMLIKVGVQI